MERDNPALKDALPREYALPALDKRRLAQLSDVVRNIRAVDENMRSPDVLGRVYGYFLPQFARAEGKKCGDFYTPHGRRADDPCCASSDMFVQPVKFVRVQTGGQGNGGRAKADFSISGQESNCTMWRIAKMSLAVRGVEGLIAHGESLHDDRHPDPEYILANPPVNFSDGGVNRLREDKRWRYGVQPKGNANFALVQHMAHHLASGCVAEFVLANESRSSSESGEGEIRKNPIKAHRLDPVEALPGQMFRPTQIPACPWPLARHRPRRGGILVIDARMVNWTHRELTDDDIARIAGAYHAWRDGVTVCEDLPGFCESPLLDELRRHGNVLRPGRNVGAEPPPDDGELFDARTSRLVGELQGRQAAGAPLDAAITENLKALGFRRQEPLK